MSTRATVWIINEESGYERFLYHHCDGYMLDEEISPVLGKLSSEEWTVDSITKAITDFDDAYREIDACYGVGWDSEYLYKIITNKTCMEKYECGIGDIRLGDCKEEKSKPEYKVETYSYGFPNYANTTPEKEDKETHYEETHYAGIDIDGTQKFGLIPEIISPERRGYLMGLADFLRNIHEKDLKKKFSLSDYEVCLVFEYMAQMHPERKG